MRCLLGLLFVTLLATRAGAEPFTNYIDKGNHYQVSVPSRWKPMDRKYAVEHHLVYGFRHMAEADFHSTVTVQVFRCPGLQVFDRSGDVASQGQLLYQRDLNLGDLPARQLLWTCTRNGKALETLSTYFVVEGKSYVLNAVTLKSRWAKVGPIFAKTAGSFRYRAQN